MASRTSAHQTRTALPLRIDQFATAACCTDSVRGCVLGLLCRDDHEFGVCCQCSQ